MDWSVGRRPPRIRKKGKRLEVGKGARETSGKGNEAVFGWKKRGDVSDGGRGKRGARYIGERRAKDKERGRKKSKYCRARFRKAAIKQTPASKIFWCWGGGPEGD